jgi:SsrA-binding protein
MSKKKEFSIENRKAYHEYFITDKYTAGMVLVGTEVKSIRLGKVSFVDSFCLLFKNELYLRNLHIAEYILGTTNNHLVVHDRKLLLQKKELRKINNELKNTGTTLIPLKIFFNEKNLAKLEIGIAKGKKLHDKRETLKNKSVEKEIQRYLKR